ncbi:DUF3574 domain-containing protein [Ideonella sp.]|uniref:DUF3574 domain-containing protein n=1 Tax=Ideonella sp. TaxID=1929293 RepID=UPI003BB759A6
MQASLADGRRAAAGSGLACHVVLVSTLALTACASAPQAVCQAGQTAQVQEWLYFGLARPGGQVTPAEWQAFLEAIVTPRFPQGLTVWAADGQWRGQDGQLQREPSRVLSLVHGGSPAEQTALTEIADAYKARFEQESVLRVRHSACVSF